ncbi:hypothetical protein E5S69_04805 [Cupriavidus necator]|uniref:hypothetical protein n=1 Tax=Cupriavidus necator TaxID=106590 RepID=UPI00148F4AF7|nr:hypothetical protein [Cupriavidus necator]NOV22856.1 hypothetical protein [Cupriavidus necator]
MTFSDIEQMDNTAGMHISQLSVTEMESVEGSVAPVVIAGVAAVSGAIANGATYWVNTPNPTAGGLVWTAGTGFTAGVVGSIAATMPPVGAMLATGAATFIPMLPEPTRTKCGAAGLAC